MEKVQVLLVLRTQYRNLAEKYPVCAMIFEEEKKKSGIRVRTLPGYQWVNLVLVWHTAVKSYRAVGTAPLIFS